MTFQELMDCWDKGKYNSNWFIYAQILDQAKKKNLVPVVGAGLSAWVGYPMWDELLRRHGAEFEVAEAVEKHLASWSYDEAAQVVEKKCGAACWYKILERTFDPKKIDERLHFRPRYQTLLPKLFTGLMLTTNFDHCLERLYNDNKKVNPNDVFQAGWADRARFFGDHLLIKLHGDIDDVGQMVLTKTSYDSYYGSDPAAPDLSLPLPSYLSRQISNRPLLFLGCSLHQDRTCAVLRQCAKGRAHYALLPMPKTEEFKQRDQELKDMEIYPLWYPAGEHDEALSAFFKQLAADCGLREEAQTDTPVYPLVGRDEVVAELCAHYSGPSPEPRWVTGVAGIGKTEVCREVIRQLSGKNPRFRMPMVDCTSAGTYLQFYAAVAKGIGLEIPAHEAADPGAFLLRAIPEDCTGVYFDNFEDIWRGVGTERRELVRWLLDLRDRGFALLFSTQDPLPPQLGRRVDLTALDSGAEHVEKLDEAEFWNMDSVKLFTYIYGDVDPGELPHLRRLVRQMEGHPLAIVLTATQAREHLMGLRTLLDRWDAVQEVYRGNERHTSLKNALALVWEEIRKDPAATFYWALHTTCVQPIPVEFHQWLVDTPELEAGMDRLRIGSLVRRDAAGISMLLPIKMQLPLLMEDWEELRVRLLLHWAAALSKLLDLANDFANPDSLQAHQLAVELMPQVCHVLDALAEQGKWGIGWLRRLLHAAHNHYQFYLSSCDTLKRLAEHPVLKDRPEDCGIAYASLGDLLGKLGDQNGSKAALEQAEERFRKSGNDMGLANTLLAKAELLRSMRDYTSANTALDRAEQLYRKSKDDLGLANVFRNRGDLLSLQKNYEGAESAYSKAEKRYRDLKVDLGLANTLRSRGTLFALQREFDKAMELLREAYPVYLELCDLKGQAECLGLQYLYLMATDRAGEAEKFRPLLEVLLPELLPPQQELVRIILAYTPSEPED